MKWIGYLHRLGFKSALVYMSFCGALADGEQYKGTNGENKHWWVRVDEGEGEGWHDNITLGVFSDIGICTIQWTWESDNWFF